MTLPPVLLGDQFHRLFERAVKRQRLISSFRGRRGVLLFIAKDRNRAGIGEALDAGGGGPDLFPFGDMGDLFSVASACLVFIGVGEASACLRILGKFWGCVLLLLGRLCMYADKCILVQICMYFRLATICMVHWLRVWVFHMVSWLL